MHRLHTVGRKAGGLTDARHIEDPAPDYKPVFTDIYQYYGNSLASFTNTINDLILQIFKSCDNYARKKGKSIQYTEFSMQKYGNMRQLFACMQLFYVTFFYQ